MTFRSRAVGYDSSDLHGEQTTTAGRKVANQRSRYDITVIGGACHVGAPLAMHVRAGLRTVAIDTDRIDSIYHTYAGLDETVVDRALEISGSHKIGRYVPATLVPVLEENRTLRRPTRVRAFSFVAHRRRADRNAFGAWILRRLHTSAGATHHPQNRSARWLIPSCRISPGARASRSARSPVSSRASGSPSSCPAPASRRSHAPGRPEAPGGWSLRSSGRASY